MRHLNFINKTAAAIALLACGTVATAADTLTLDQAVSIALDNNRGIRSSVLEAQKSHDN